MAGKRITNDELIEVIRKHSIWIKEEEEDCDERAGERANLSGMDLSYMDLRDIDLRYAILRNTNLRNADLCGANLRCADLRDVDLSDSYLIGTNLTGADLRGADLSDVYANNVDLKSADLRGACLRDVYLTNANLRDADLSGVYWRNVIGGYQMCPSEGEFIGWKKCRTSDNVLCIVKLLIPADAKRSSATTEKCRTDKAVVLEIQDLDGNKIEDNAYSIHGCAQNFEYKVGETVEPKELFCEDRWQECASGIHFFIDRRAAVEY